MNKLLDPLKKIDPLLQHIKLDKKKVESFPDLLLVLKNRTQSTDFMIQFFKQSLFEIIASAKLAKRASSSLCVCHNRCTRKSCNILCRCRFVNLLPWGKHLLIYNTWATAMLKYSRLPMRTSLNLRQQLCDLLTKPIRSILLLHQHLRLEDWRQVRPFRSQI